MLNTIEVDIDSKHSPLGTAQHGIQQMATYKTTAANYGHGDAGIVKR